MYDLNFDFSSISSVTDKQILCMFIFSAIIFVLLYFYRRIVSIYNMNFEGQLLLVGYAYMHLGPKGYYVIISRRHRERAYTKHYCVVINDMCIGRDEGGEVYFYLDGKGETASFGEEMEVVF